MTRAGVTYVAMTAAAISVGALGYAVIWSFREPDAALVMTQAAPAQEIAAVATPQPKQDVAAGSPAAPVAAPSVSLPVAPNEEPPREPASTQASPSRNVETMPLPPDQRLEKLQTASAPKDTTTFAVTAVVPVSSKSESLPARTAEKPVVAQPSPSAAVLPRLSVAVAPPAVPKIESPSEPAPPAREAAAQPVTALTVPESSATSKVAPTQAPATDPAALLSPSPERPAIESRPKQFRAIPPPQREQRSALVTSHAAAPVLDSPAATTAAPASPSAPSNAAALAPPAEDPEQPPAPPLALPKASEPPAKPMHPAAPPSSAIAPDRPHISVIRGNHRHATPARARAPERQKIAALPSGAAATHTATDSAPILVLRGTRRPRYALASVPQGAPEPLLTVIRGARPRPVILMPYVQPNALILHIRH